ncbi:MAG TPA: carbohydrate ABC transporter permease [Clostridiales bacterium]|nr:carbohydrate ABC transporter permease [Clostridiales bacterium]
MSKASKKGKRTKHNIIPTGSLLFDVLNHIFLGIVALSCILPLIHVLAISFSVSWAAQGGIVYFWPVGFNLESYKFILKNGKFITALIVSLKRVTLGVAINLFLIILTAYPLSKEEHDFKGRTLYAWFLFITILFSGGLIPSYMNIRSLGLLDNILALILPGAVPVFSVVLLLNFFRQLPKGVEESAFVDGASFWTTLWKICVPMSLPSIATIALFSAVAHWNSWFDGIIYMNRTDKYPLQSYLQTIIMMASSSNEFIRATPEMAELLKKINDSTLKAAQIFLGALPIILVYPFLQRFFMKGIVIGSIKG